MTAATSSGGTKSGMVPQRPTDLTLAWRLFKAAVKGLTILGISTNARIGSFSMMSMIWSGWYPSTTCTVPPRSSVAMDLSVDTM